MFNFHARAALYDVIGHAEGVCRAQFLMRIIDEFICDADITLWYFRGGGHPYGYFQFYATSTHETG